jgi:tetratricopeptide (TPR) repeat protein
MGINDEPKRPVNAGEPVVTSPAGEITPAGYLREVKVHLTRGKQKEAFGLLQQAAVIYPNDPIILSYYGYLLALVDKKYRGGVETCARAIALLKKKASLSGEVPYAVPYLNLGRAYLAAGKKKDAIEALKKGLQYDNDNNDLLKELKALGKRGKPPVKFLERANPINKFIGLTRKKTTKGTDK